jgi:hypothetical protein
MEEIELLINRQIEDELRNGMIIYAHGITINNIKQHLIVPIKQTYVSDFGNNISKLELWTVLEENPIGRNGYKIFYDPEDDKFGLGMTDKNGILQYLGTHGTFIDTLNGM